MNYLPAAQTLRGSSENWEALIEENVASRYNLGFFLNKKHR